MIDSSLVINLMRNEDFNEQFSLLAKFMEYHHANCHLQAVRKKNGVAFKNIYRNE